MLNILSKLFLNKLFMLNTALVGECSVTGRSIAIVLGKLRSSIHYDNETIVGECDREEHCRCTRHTKRSACFLRPTNSDPLAAILVVTDKL